MGIITHLERLGGASMKICEIPNNTAIYVCSHVFRKEKTPILFASEETGELVATCGCIVEGAHLVGFGHIYPYFKAIAVREVPEPGTHLQFEKGLWTPGELE